MSFWLNKSIKKEFTKTCKVKNTNMSVELNRFIRSYIEENKAIVSEQTNMFGDVITTSFMYDENDEERDTGW